MTQLDRQGMKSPLTLAITVVRLGGGTIEGGNSEPFNNQPENENDSSNFPKEESSTSVEVEGAGRSFENPAYSDDTHGSPAAPNAVATAVMSGPAKESVENPRYAAEMSIVTQPIDAATPVSTDTKPVSTEPDKTDNSQLQREVDMDMFDNPLYMDTTHTHNQGESTI
ncbi:uncharacterized protein LOC143710335 [Siphateles boraxobius]|uniref:uncharacterized protein LOC143710335 n=1 Tax=Siphateles boraxobius TaxID=180520 RepID=UPI004063D521